MHIKAFVSKVTIGVTACLFTATGFMTTVATAQGTDTTEYNPIWCALRAGVNLDIEATSHCNTVGPGNTAAPTTTAADTTVKPANPPKNSGTGSQPTPTPASVPAQTGGYAALGDSVAAGLGLSASSNAGDSQCGRSTQGYPNIVASSLGLPLINAACSGATAGDLVTQQRISGRNPQAQLDTAFVNGTPELMTLTAGANDAHWATLIKGCYAYDCTGSAYQAAASTYLSVLQTKLYYAMYSIQNRSGGNQPQVILTGYYDPLEMNCSQRYSQITPSEIRWIQNETDELNGVIQTVASNFSFATYVPVSFAGHGACAASPWVQGLNDPAPLHPTATGQRVIANQILKAVKR